MPARIAQRPYPAEHRVPGCESEAYVWAEPSPDGTLTYYFAVENPQGISAMALAGILRDSLSGAPLEEVAAVPADVVYRIFGRELSMGKSLGLMGMVNMVRTAARQQMQPLHRTPVIASSGSLLFRIQIGSAGWCSALKIQVEAKLQLGCF